MISLFSGTLATLCHSSRQDHNYLWIIIARALSRHGSILMTILNSGRVGLKEGCDSFGERDVVVEASAAHEADALFLRSLEKREE